MHDVARPCDLLKIYRVEVAPIGDALQDTLRGSTPNHKSA